MFDKSEYELLDFGGGRKLERFGPLILDRPSPAAAGIARRRDLWSGADAVFQETAPVKTSSGNPVRGVWQARTELGRRYFAESAGETSEWTVRHSHAEFVMRLQGSPFGHIGIFPEQSENWDTVYNWCHAFAKKFNRRARLLNLFAYTGGTTLAAMAAGAETTHLDAAKNIVARARANAELSFPGHAARWIADDAVRYVTREVKRDSCYDAVILDPPTYGHGARGEVWRFRRSLPKLLEGCRRLLRTPAPLLLLTCHVTDLTPSRLAELITDSLGDLPRQTGSAVIHPRETWITATTGARMPAGLRVLLTPRDFPS